MRIASVSLNSMNCQPLRFGHCDKCCSTNGHHNSSCNNIEQKYDLACRIIALQKKQLIALKGQNKK